jgi:nicotinamide mononucleotide transporter
LSVLEELVAGLAAITAVEWIAVALALAYVFLAIAQNAWCWPVAAVSAVLYLVLFERSGLHMQAALQLFYLGMATYGWRTWRTRIPERAVAVHRWSWQRHALALGLVALVAALNGALLSGDPSKPWLPYVDAAIAWGSVVASWMVARKVLENWLYWIVADLAAAVLAAGQGLLATALLFLVYTVLATRGYLQWRRDERALAPAT